MQDNPQALLPKPQLPVVPPPGSRPLSNARHEHYCRLRSLLRPKAQALREAGMRAVKSPQTHSNNSSANLHTYKFHPRKPAETENLRLPSGGERCGYHYQSPRRSRKRASARMRRGGLWRTPSRCPRCAARARSARISLWGRHRRIDLPPKRQAANRADGRVKTIETRTAHTRSRHAHRGTARRVNMTNQDCSLGDRLAAMQENKRIRRYVPLVVDVGSIISIIGIMLAVLIVIWAIGREARVAWGAA
jgi:hypothetical protein